MEMFNLEMYVEDKNLAKVKRALAGLVIELRDAPVVNAEKKANGAMAAKTSGNIVDMLLAYCRQHKLDTINRAMAGKFARSIGRKESSATYILQMAGKAGVLRKFGKGNACHYKIIKK